jgi:hypothetical protein
MKWEHKIGIAITCTFLCLVGAVLGLKMQEQTPAESPNVAESVPADPTPIKPDKKNTIPFDDKEMSFSKLPEPPGLPPPLPNQKDKSPTEKAHTTPELPLGGPRPSPSPMSSMMDASAAGNNPARDKTNPAIGPTPPPSGLVESSPSLPPIGGAGEWGKYSRGSGGNNQSATPAAPKNDTKTMSPTLSPSPESKKQPPANPSVSPTIVPASGVEPPLSPLDSQAKPVPLPTSPTTPTLPGSGNTTTPPPIAPSIGLGNPMNSGAPSVPPGMGTPLQPGMPSPSLQPPTTLPSALDPKDKERITPYPAGGSTNPPGMPKPPPTPTPPLPSMNAAQGPSMNPAIVSPTPAPPTLPPTTTPPPSLAPMPVPLIDPNSKPAPAPSATPPSPPKPPNEGSSFIPDPSASTSGPVGVKPAPLPFPVPPPSSPLASAPERPTPPPPQVQPASTAPSVTVYDEQEYSCKPGDSWEAISKNFYMTDRYAKALARHNQNHARASGRIRDTGQLAPGERVFVPQAYVLEDRYADAIPRPTAAPPSTAMPATFVAPSGGTAPPPQPPTPPPQP